MSRHAARYYGSTQVLLALLIILGSAVLRNKKFTSRAATRDPTPLSAGGGYRYKIVQFAYGDPKPVNPDGLEQTFMRNLGDHLPFTVEPTSEKYFEACGTSKRCDAVKIEEDVKSTTYFLECYNPADPTGQHHGKLEPYKCYMSDLDSCRDEASRILARTLVNHHNTVDEPGSAP